MVTYRRSNPSTHNNGSTHTDHDPTQATDYISTLNPHFKSISEFVDDPNLPISTRLHNLRNLLEMRQNRRITDEELASLLAVSKSSIGNWKRDVVKSLLPETERRFQELVEEAKSLDPDQPITGSLTAPRGIEEVDLVKATVKIVTAYIDRCPEPMAAEELGALVRAVKQNLAS